MALSSAAASLFVGSGFVATDSAAAACADTDGEQTAGTAGCTTPEHETSFSDTDVSPDSTDDGAANPATREQPCCAGAGLTDQQIQEMPEAEWAELVERSEAERRNQEQIIKDQRAYDDWELVYDEANDLVQQSALALEMNDLAQAEELHRQASEVWSRAPELSFHYGSSRGRELYGVETALVAVDEALNDGGRPVTGGARAKLNLPELPSRVIDPPSEPEGLPGQAIAVDDLDLGSLSWALDDVLDGDPRATRTVNVTLTQANSETLVTAAVEVALVDGQITEVLVEGVPIQSARERVERDLNRIRPPQSTDVPSLEDTPEESDPEEIPTRPEAVGFDDSAIVNSLPPIDLDFTSSIDANMWGLHSPNGSFVGNWSRHAWGSNDRSDSEETNSDADREDESEPTTPVSAVAVDDESEPQSNTIAAPTTSVDQRFQLADFGTDMWPIEDWLSQTSSGGFGFGGAWSFNGESEVAPSSELGISDEIPNPVNESQIDPFVFEIPASGNISDLSPSNPDGQDDDTRQFSLGTTSMFSNDSDFSSSELLGQGFSTNDSPDADESQGTFGNGLVNDDLSFERFSFANDSFDDGAVDGGSDDTSLVSPSDDGPVASDRDQSSSDSDYSGFDDLSFESSLDNDSFDVSASGFGDFSLDSSIDRSFGSESVDVGLGTGATGFGDLSADDASSGGGSGFDEFSEPGSLSGEPLDISTDEPSGSPSDSGSSGGFSFSFGGISFDW